MPGDVTSRPDAAVGGRPSDALFAPDRYPMCCLYCGSIVLTFSLTGYCATCRRHVATYRSTMTNAQHAEHVKEKARA